jgi:hypothetical protein
MSIKKQELINLYYDHWKEFKDFDGVIDNEDFDIEGIEENNHIKYEDIVHNSQDDKIHHLPLRKTDLFEN